MKSLIRKIKREDTKAISHVVTISWNETYKGIVPDAYLEELKHNEEERANNFYNKFDEKDDRYFVLEVDENVVGFVRYDKANDPDYDKCGEIIALYIINKYHGFGYGKMLVNRAIVELKKMGFNKMIISCLKGNPSNEFYKHIGGVYVKDGVYKRLNIKENVYLFNL